MRLVDAIGRQLAEDVVAQHDLPHYASSAMDGWAVRGEGPWMIVPDGSVLERGWAMPIVTGGLVPDGVLGILRSENANVGDGFVSTETREPLAGQHVRLPGREAKRSERVIASGVTINPAHVALAAGCGYDTLQVAGRPRVSFVFSGDEVVDSGIPGPGQVRDSFGPQLPVFLRMLGTETVSVRRVRDSLSETVSAIAADPPECEIIVTTGGTGDSAVDHVRTALSELGAQLIIDGISMRPGGPTMLAKLPDGRLVVALPGNPLAAMMGILTVVAPLIGGLGSFPTHSLGRITCAVELPGKPGNSALMPYRIHDGLAIVDDWQGSAMMRGLAAADGVLIVPPDGVRKGEVVETVALPWN